jgi:hypothetical protein
MIECLYLVGTVGVEANQPGKKEIQVKKLKLVRETVRDLSSVVGGICVDPHGDMHAKNLPRVPTVQTPVVTVPFNTLVSCPR